jgi:hypothetical protein
MDWKIFINIKNILKAFVPGTKASIYLTILQIALCVESLIRVGYCIWPVILIPILILSVIFQIAWYKNEKAQA